MIKFWSVLNWTALFAGIYKLAYEESRFGITREQCAKSILPFLIASSMENTLNMPQFEQYMALIHRILDKVIVAC